MISARARRCALATLVSFANAACIETIPPPSRPTRESVPENVHLLPPVAGRGRVVIDATNGPAQVEEIVGSEAGYVYGRRGTLYSEGEIAKPVCASTPCSANLDYGQHLLRFRSLADPNVHGRGTVTADAGDAAFLHTMGGFYPGGATYRTGAAFMGLGFLGGLVGGSLIVAGAIRNAGPDDTDPGRGLITGGEITLGIGIGLMILGGVIAEIDHPTTQEGSSQQFPIETRPAPSPAVVVPAPPAMTSAPPPTVAPSGSSL